MGYSKTIKYGHFVESYRYERHLGHRGVRKSHARQTRMPVLVLPGSDPLSDSEAKAYAAKRKDNARRASLVFRRLVAAQLGGVEIPLLLTFTYKENRADLHRAYSDFTFFNKTWRRRFGNAFRYIAVPEFQKRGAVHFHVLYWGLPPECCSRWLEGRLRGKYANISPDLSADWGHGFVFLKQTDGNDKLSSYLSKYMAKSFVEYNLANQKAYVASRNCMRPQVITGVDSVEVLLHDVIGVDNVPLQSFEYDTQWLGKCIYKKYNIIL